jgi:hypothetical protein
VLEVEATMIGTRAPRSTLIVMVALLALLTTVAHCQKGYSADHPDAMSSGYSAVFNVQATVWSGAIAAVDTDEDAVKAAQRVVTVDSTNSLVNFDVDKCNRNPNAVAFSSPDKSASFLRRRGQLVPFYAIRCVNSTRLTITIQRDPFFVPRPGGEVIIMQFLVTIFRDIAVNGYPFDPAKYSFWFRIRESTIVVRTGINDDVLAVAYGTGAVSSLFAALVTNHPTLATVMPRCSFLFAISLCSFSTMYSVDVLQYPIQISFGDSATDVWAQFRAVGTMNAVFVVAVLVVVFGGQLAKSYRAELTAIDDALVEKRIKIRERKEAQRRRSERRAHELAVAATKLTHDELRKLDAELKKRDEDEAQRQIQQKRREKEARRRKERARKTAPITQKGSPAGAAAESPRDAADATRLDRLRNKRRQMKVNRRQRGPTDAPYDDGVSSASDSSRDSVTYLLMREEVQLGILQVPVRHDDAMVTSSESEDANDPRPHSSAHILHRDTTTRLRLPMKPKHAAAPTIVPPIPVPSPSPLSGNLRAANRSTVLLRYQVAIRRMLRHGVTKPGHRFAGSTVVLTLVFLLFKASVSSSAVLLWNVAETGTRVGMVFVLLLWFFAPFAVMVYVFGYAFSRRCDVVWRDAGGKLQTNYDMFTHGEGHWEVIIPAARRPRNACRLALTLPLFEHYRPGREWFVVLELLWSTLFGVLEATRTDRGCEVIAGPAAVLGFSYLIALGVLRPHITPFDRVFHLLLAVVYTVAPLAQMVYFLAPTVTVANVFASSLIVAALFATVSRFIVALVQLHDFVQYRCVHQIPWWIFARIRKWTLGRKFYERYELSADNTQADIAAPRAGDTVAVASDKVTPTGVNPLSSLPLRADGLPQLPGVRAPSTAEALRRLAPPHSNTLPSATEASMSAGSIAESSKIAPSEFGRRSFGGADSIAASTSYRDGAVFAPVSPRSLEEL